MHEKLKHLFAQKPQRQNKLPLPLLDLLLQIIFNINFSIRIFAITLHLISCSFSLTVTLTNLSSIFLRAKMIHNNNLLHENSSNFLEVC